MAETPATSRPADKRRIILDTNIISRLDGSLGTRLFEVINEVVALGYGIAISDMTYMELLTGANSKQEKQIGDTLKGVDHYIATTQVFIAAAHMASLYKELHDLNQFEIGDRIIAGTAALNNAIIFTLNGRHYPVPFFKEIDRRKLEYENKGMPVCSYGYFMEPQIDVINESHHKRLGIETPKKEAVADQPNTPATVKNDSPKG